MSRSLRVACCISVVVELGRRGWGIAAPTEDLGGLLACGVTSCGVGLATGAAAADGRAARCDVRIGVGELVAVVAVRLADVPVRPERVLFESHRLEVLRVHTGGVAA